MMNAPRLPTAIATACVCMAAHAVDVPSSVTLVPGTPFSTPALANSATTGADMGGMIVTVFFAGAPSSSAVWTATGPTGGQALGSSGWSLSLDGDSFSNPWGLSNGDGPAIIRFTIDAAPGSAAFDVVAGDALSPGSANGRPFGDATVNATGLTSAQATYSNQTFVGGTFYGDLYESLSVTLMGTGLPARSLLEFFADTDSAAVSGTITPSIPEPETYALLLAGLCLVRLSLRRRRQT